jgi:hypothetical protein
MDDLGLAPSGADVPAVLEGPYAQGGGARVQLRLFAVPGEQRPHGRAADFQGPDKEIRDEHDSEGGEVVARYMGFDSGQAPAGGDGVHGSAGSGVGDAQHGASVGRRRALRR